MVSQFDLVAKNPISGLEFFLMHANQVFWTFFDYAKNRTSSIKNLILRTLYNMYFCHVTILEWSQNFTRTIRKFIWGTVIC